MLFKSSIESLEETPQKVQKTLSTLTELASTNSHHYATIHSESQSSTPSLAALNSALLRLYENEKKAEAVVSNTLAYVQQQLRQIDDEREKFQEMAASAALATKAARISHLLGLSHIRESDEGDAVYCYCRKPSKGNMIACDDPACDIEWFHYGCVGLTSMPSGKWYCKNCKEKNK
ncbi:Protein YNG1 [Astathelohania contejeani]|uniref:Protein YNG1 n=1 Tax=Astathelohania contejeani TaxID=164912 RepID=A0ABQ7I0T3_9MICR|nr:Protein YNG1 [Thelohania contejeani]